MRKRIATTSMVIVLLVCCVGVSNTKADDNNEYGILSNMGFSHSERNGFETWRTEMSSCHFLRTGTERLPRCQGKRPGPPRPMTLTLTMTKEEESYMW